MGTGTVEPPAQGTDPPVEAPDTVKVSFNLPREEAETLSALAAKRGVTITQVLREAIADEALLRREIDAGNKIVVIQSDGTRRELLFK